MADNKTNLPAFMTQNPSDQENRGRLGNLTRAVDRTVSVMVRNDYKSENEVMDAARGPVRFGLWVLFAMFALGFTWSFLAELQTAAVAPGSIVLDSNKKVIQHLEGGIIKKILVRDGDFAEAGQSLIQLDETNAKARFDILVSQVRTLRANEIRLIAERESREAITFNDPWLTDTSKPEIQTILKTQTQLFESRTKSLKGQIEVLYQRIEQSKEEISGLQAQENASRKQIGYLNDEIATVNKLVKKGQALKPRLLALQRQASELTGRMGEYQALIARARQTITQAEVEIINTTTIRQSEIERELRDVQSQLADFSERLKAAEDVRNRLDIVAPQSGIVANLAFHTIGGVIQPGVPILEIVPSDDKLIVEAKVNLNDIDVVHPELPARVRLSAFKVRKVPVLEGKVITVSADRIVDKNTGMAYYTARVEINPEEINEHITEKIELYPGMPAEVLIVTGTRSVMSYIFTPITDSFFRAFKEQ